MAEQEAVKLLGGWYSPFAVRVEWALKLKGIKYLLAEEDITNKSSLLLNSNPIYKKIPVLIHNQKPICESLVILEYIDETWEHNPILPQDPGEKAVARFWAKFVEDKLTEAIRRTLYSEGEEQEKEVKLAKDAMEVLEGELNKLKGKKFFGGEKIGLVDIVLGWITIWLEVIEEICSIEIFDPEEYPCMNKWMKNFLELPIVKENLTPRDNLVHYFQQLPKLKAVRN